VVDVSTPASPFIVGSLDFPGSAADVFVAGNLAYAATGAGLRVVDVSDPEEPVLVGSVPSVSLTGVFVDGNYAYATDWTLGCHVIDVTNPVSPILLSTVDTGGTASGIFVTGGYAYVGIGASEAVFIDVSIPALARVVGSVGVPRFALGIYVRDGLCYIAGRDDGLVIADVSNPVAPNVVGSISVGGWKMVDLALSGEMTFVVGSRSGRAFLLAINVSSASPTIVADLVLPGNSGATCVAVSGNHAYVGANFEGTFVVDISDPTEPVVVGGADGFGCIAIDVDANVACVNSPNGIVTLFDLSDPTAPAFIGTIDLPGQTHSVDLDGDLLFVSGTNASGTVGIFRVIDVSIPASPVVIGSVNTINPRHFHRVGDRIFLGDEAGLTILDVSIPAFPVVLGSIDTPDFAADAIADGDLVYVADGDCGIHAFNASNPASPQFLGTFNTPGLATRLELDGSHIQVINQPVFEQVAGFSILPLQCTAASVDPADISDGTSRLSMSTAPNPLSLAGGGSETTFRLDSDMRVSLHVFDASGRLIRTLLDRQLAPGRHSVSWDGRSQDGRTVPSGTYFYRLNAGPSSESCLVTVIR
jgi:hypothetical protein